jgi:hypothetical protein
MFTLASEANGLLEQLSFAKSFFEQQLEIEQMQKSLR